MVDHERVALLIDCDNISPRLVTRLIAEASTYGTVSVRRAYGDWSNHLLSGWREVLAAHAIQPIHQPAYVTGKNATDSALIIDSMDLLYADHVGTFVIVSNDSDYTRLAMRLRESARRVCGIGSRTAAAAFQSACDRFTWTDLLPELPTESPGFAVEPDQIGGRPDADSAEAEAQLQTATPAPLLALPDLLIPAIQACADEEGWAPLATVGWRIVGVYPAFDSRAYGYQKLSQLVRDQPYLEVQRMPDPAGTLQPRVRVKQ